jgi:cytidylate kinase
MTTITISRQLGSSGLQVARLVAERLGYRLVWRELINQAALRASAPEMALAVIDELGLLDIQPTQEAVQAYHRAVRQVVTELADEGQVVILGRGGQAILHGRADVLSVLLVAPKEPRAARLASHHGISMRAALAQVHASDRYRRQYLKHNYQIRWDDPEYYDLILNTARLTPQAITDLICHLHRACLPANSATPA